MKYTKSKKSLNLKGTKKGKYIAINQYFNKNLRKLERRLRSNHKEKKHKKEDRINKQRRIKIMESIKQYYQGEDCDPFANVPQTDLKIMQMYEKIKQNIIP
jgi:DNA polymerase II small subunit/DNA polymerase delta subunit B